eukprot:GHVN01060067.1.p2 GENE.GHVN01060067.1~~GHVN01060067.1.p2  ORF type:complete len:391 (-),score=44.34 GHVN01060067.1:2024-3196(-)
MSTPFGQAGATSAPAQAPAAVGTWVPPQRRDAGGPQPSSSSPQPAQNTTTATRWNQVGQTHQTTRDGRGLRRVKIDSLVLIKILKHCRDHYPAPVNGQLVGLDVEGSLEVTNCFPLKDKSELYAQFAKDNNEGIEEKVEEEHTRYQCTMVDLMHELRGDCFSVGWYQTMSFEDIKDKDIINSLCFYQDTIPYAVTIGFDPLLNSMGRMAFRAYRVSDEFLKIHKEAEDSDPRAYSRLKAKDVLLEVPLVIDNPVLIDAFLEEWNASDRLKVSEFDNLQLDQSEYMEKSMGYVAQALDQLGMEIENLNRHRNDARKNKEAMEKRKVENDQRRLRGEAPIALDVDVARRDAPSQLGTLLLSNRVGAISGEVSSIATDNLIKTYLVQERFSKS